MAKLIFQYDEDGWDPRQTSRKVSSLVIERVVVGDGTKHNPGAQDLFERAAAYGGTISNKLYGLGGNATAAGAAAFLLWRQFGRVPEDYIVKGDPLESAQVLAYDFLGRVRSGLQISEPNDPVNRLRNRIRGMHIPGSIAPAWQELAAWLMAWRDVARGVGASSAYTLSLDASDFPRVFLPDMEGLRLARDGGKQTSGRGRR